MMLSWPEGGWSRQRREEMKTNSMLKDICDHCEHLQRECDIFIGYLLHKLYIGLSLALYWVAPVSIMFRQIVVRSSFRNKDEKLVNNDC